VSAEVVVAAEQKAVGCCYGRGVAPLQEAISVDLPQVSVYFFSLVPTGVIVTPKT
jgi:hypothetical protein